MPTTLDPYLGATRLIGKRIVTAGRFRPRSALHGLLLAAFAATASCGGEGPTPPAPPPPPLPPPPVAPVQVGTIPNQAIATGQSATLEVSAYFRDPDGGALTYTAASSSAGVVSVSLSGSTLTMVGVADGTATVTVTARDPDGLTAAQGFRVTVATPNRAPEAVGTIPNQMVATGSAETVDVSSYFRDPDGDVLTYEAASSAAAVISVSLSGTTLTMVGVADGMATVTVTARDPGALAAEQSFRVTVATPNRAPEAVGTIPDRTINTGSSSSVDVASYFRDPDGDALTYTGASSNGAVATAVVSGSRVTISAVADGMATVTVTARDPDGLAAAQGFQVTVETPNRAPEAVGTIPDHTVQIGETVAFDVSPHFTDADGDELTYATASGNTSVATVSVSGAAVRIQGVGVGRTTLTVTARDPDGASATQQADVEVTDPGPDLAFAGVSPASSTLTPGDSVTFTFRIHNQGTVAASATTIRTMRSANPTISPRDTELESYSLSSLAPAQHRSFPVTIVVDWNSAPGTIYIGMCVDAVTNESNARNNCSEGARLMIVRSSSAQESLESGPSVRIRVSRPRESTRPAAPPRGTEPT